MDDFAGFPEAALDFYDDLEMDNTKSFWEAHRSTYDEAVAKPMKALMGALEPEFGTAKVFRPYRDVRFAKDKTPYKTHQGAYIALAPSTGYYVQIAASGVLVGVGFYEASSERLAAVRSAIDDDAHGADLEKIVGELTDAGWKLGGDQVKTAPRGYDIDHPRIALLRHKSMTLGKDLAFAPVIHSPALVDEVRTNWREATPFLDWVLAHAKA
jgi:uncharacterized protein (TIGR02453 family)